MEEDGYMDTKKVPGKQEAQPMAIDSAA